MAPMKPVKTKLWPWLCQAPLHTHIQSTYSVIHFLKLSACALLVPGS